MSSTIKQAIQALKARIADAYTAIANKGGTLPATQDSANLPAAIASIPSGGATGWLRANRINMDGVSQDAIDLLGASLYDIAALKYLTLGNPTNTQLEFSAIQGFKPSDMVNFVSSHNSSLLYLDITAIDTSACTSFNQMAYGNRPRIIDMTGCSFAAVGTAWSAVVRVIPDDITTIIGNHTEQEVEDGEVACFVGLKHNIEFGALSGYYIQGRGLQYPSLLAIAKGVADMTGQTQPTITFNGANIWSRLTQAQQDRIGGILLAKNWILNIS